MKPCSSLISSPGGRGGQSRKTLGLKPNPNPEPLQLANLIDWWTMKKAKMKRQWDQLGK
eukprot:CAMPEP_0182860398 /NCGR_PEP_ID=MMETSP0034_2-20130328/4898_1 /TAXON_ID=156128 /ORGANISM="Nephroselmis pyriformis, Strain CCMP717" /LENGTH=58 /DNA_ID=CAMNT_0024992191 /DNA_START=251 /DNA_END=424 /DNA_ORIENTATION=-